MKKVLAVIFGLVAILAAAVVVLPEVIDWNDHRDAISRQARDVTGRELTIAGDIKIALLPAPALVANDVSLANIDGAVAPEMIRVKSLEIRVALGPLLGGVVQVETIKMVDPVIELERLANGQVNWEFTPIDRKAGGSVSTPLPGVAPLSSGDDEAAAISLDNFLIANGTVVFRDSKNNLTERIERLDAQLAAASLGGPFDSAGSLFLRGVPLDYEVAVGRVIEGRTVPLNMILRAEPGRTKAELSGAVVDLAQSPRFKGKVVVGGEALASLIDDLMGTAVAPAYLKDAFRVESEVVVSADGLDMKEAIVSLGPVRAGGEIKVNFTQPVNFDAKLMANRIDLDALLAPPVAGKAASDEAGKGEASDGGSQDVAVPIKPVQGKGVGFSIPGNLTGNLEFSAPAISFRGSVISEAHIDAAIGGGEITISQLSAQLPGGSELFATGFLTAEGGKPKFDGNVDARFSDLRRVLTWLAIEIPVVPSDRLRSVDFKGRIIADSRQIQGLNLNATVDTSHITGGVTLALRKRLAFGADLKLDRLNLDAYLQPEETGPDASGAAARPDEGAAASSERGQKTDNPLAFLDFLNAFDANLKLEVGHLSYRRLPIDEIVFDGTLFGGSLEIRNASIGDFAGASGKVDGRLVGLTQVPGFENLHFDLRGADMVRLLRLFEIDAPFSSKDVGVVGLTGRANGSMLRPELDLILKTPDASLDMDGRLSVLPIEPLFDGAIKVRHTDFPQFMRLLGVTYRPSGRINGFGLAAKVKGDLTTTAFEEITGKIGSVDLAGALTLDRSGSRPRIVADIDAGRIVVDPFLPAKSSAFLDSNPWPAPAQPRLIPATWRSGGDGLRGENHILLAAASSGAPWSTERLDLSFLQSFDADVKLRSPDVTHGDVSFLDGVLEATVDSGVLGVKSLTGRLFGGEFTGSATVRSGPPFAIDGAVLLTGGDFGEFDQALRGQRAARGNIGMRLTFASSGQNVAELVSVLAGEGSFEIRGMELNEGAENARLGAVSGLLSGLDQLSDTVGNEGEQPEGTADASGAFKIDQGVAKSENLKFISNLGEGKAKGSADLVNWDLKVDGEIQLSKNVFARLLSGTTGAKLIVPFRVTGALDQPNIAFQTSKLPGKVLSIPGQILEKALDKTGISNVLKRLIPKPQQ